MNGDARFASVDGFFLDRMIETKLPGIAYSLIVDGEVQHQRGLGFRNIESRLPVTPETLFGLGSVTKVFTALCILQLQERGALSLDDALTDYFPVRLSRFDEPVRLWHLLSHTSGLPALGLSETKMSDQWFMTGYPVADVDDLLAFLEGAAAWAECPPGERWFYLNEGYMLLGSLIKRLSGQEYTAYVREHLLLPLGMERTFWRAEEVASDGDAATPYMLDRAGSHFVGANLISSLPAAGGLVSNVVDMNRFLLMFMNGGRAADGTPIISEASLDTLWNPRVSLPQEVDECQIEGLVTSPGVAMSFGCGLQSQIEFGGQRIVSHGGGVMGGTTYLAVMPERQLGTIVLSNGHGYPMGQLALAALAAAQGLAPSTLPFVRRQDVMQSLVGEYEAFRGTIRASVRRRGDWMELRLHFHHETRVVTLLPVYLSDQSATFVTLTGGRRLKVEFRQEGDGLTLIYERYKFQRSRTGARSE